MRTTAAVTKITTRTADVAYLSELVERYQGAMLRVAFRYLHSLTLAEDAVQDTWAAVIENFSSFQGRCSLKNWIFRILVNKAKNRLFRESRSVPFSSFSDSNSDDSTLDPSDFSVDTPTADLSQSWKTERPEVPLLRKETMRSLEKALEELTPNQRAVVTLRDIEDLDAGEVCSVLQIAAANQRVLLHRGRSKLRQALAQHLRAA